MTGFLASVMNLDEALIVQAAQADIIDLKNPHCGALGAVSETVINEVVQSLRGKAVISATVGDLPADPEQMLQEVLNKSQCGVDYVKVGMFSQEHVDQCIPKLRDACQQGIAVIAVLFADSTINLHTTIKQCSKMGFSGVMLDTADKSAGSLRNHLGIRELQQFIRQAHDHHLLTGLAGSLKQDDILPLLSLSPDYLGFRTALCRKTERTQAIDPQATIHIRHLIPSADDIQVKIA